MTSSKGNDLIEKARSFALKKHAGQMYGEAPYALHLADVARIADEYGMSEEVIAAAWLHDTIEDTGTTVEKLTKLFGNRVALLVHLVSDPPGLPNRKARKQALLERLTTEPARSTVYDFMIRCDATALHLCDLIANVEDAVKNNPKALKMYIKETPELIRLRLALVEHGLCIGTARFSKLWCRLESAIHMFGGNNAK